MAIFLLEEPISRKLLGKAILFLACHLHGYQLYGLNLLKSVGKLGTPWSVTEREIFVLLTSCSVRKTEYFLPGRLDHHH